MSSPSLEGCSAAKLAGMSSRDQNVHGPTGKPSQAEGEDPDRPAEESPQPAEGHPSQAEGEDADEQR